ncbi:MAG: ABC transporter ATP-binding protein [Roseburia sp.]
MLKEKSKEKKRPAFSNIWYAISLLWHGHKWFVLFELFYAVFSAVRTILPVLILQKIIELLDERASISTFLFYITGMVGGLFVIYMIHKWYNISFIPIETRKIKNDIRIRLLMKAKETDYIRFDDAGFFDLYTRCIQEGEERLLGVIWAFCEFITAICSISGLTAIMLSMDSHTVAISLFLLSLTSLISLLKNKVDYAERTDRLPIERQNDYIKRLFYMKQFAKEIKVLALDKLLLMRQQKVSDDLICNVKKYRRKKLPLGLLEVLISSISEFGLWIYLGVLVLVGRITLGALMGLQSATVNFMGQLGQLFRIIPNLQNHALYIDDFRNFLEGGSSKKTNVLPSPDRFISLKLQNVNFTYEGSGFSLKDLSLTIEAGEKIAIVGENGSGKSTLIKILMNLYHPASGKIYYNGKPYSEYDDEALHSAFGAVFQDVQSYDMTVAEYVLLREYTEADYPLVWDALKKCGLYEFVQKLPKGLETHISTEFDPEGMELSGGQLQKLAIARIYAGDYDFIILDEPTSALDPRSEYEFNKTLFDIAKDKTVIFISHRLSTTRFADKIYLMDGGRIIEEGSHDELMQIEQGHYRELFNMQAEYYVENGEHQMA